MKTWQNQESYPKTVPDNHLAQKDIQVHKKGKKPERNKEVIIFYLRLGIPVYTITCTYHEQHIINLFLP